MREWEMQSLTRKGTHEPYTEETLQAAVIICILHETILCSLDFNGLVTRFARYRPFRFVVAIALLLSMAMPLVTYACDLTGLIETPVTMAEHSAESESSDEDCPCEGPMGEMCGSRAAECASVANCHGHSLDSDACCSSHAELTDAVVSDAKKLLQLQPVVVVVIVEQPVQLQVDSVLKTPGQERAPPLKAPIRILHSSLLL